MLVVLTSVSLLAMFSIWIYQLRSTAKNILGWKPLNALIEFIRLGIDIGIFFLTLLFIGGTTFGLQVAAILNIGSSLIVQLMVKNRKVKSST